MSSDSEVSTDNEKNPTKEESSEVDESEEENDDEVEEPSIDDLKENVTYYLKIDDTIRDKKDEIKELVEKRLKYEEFIKKYLERTNKTKIDTKDGEIVFKKSSVKAPIKEEIIEKAIVAKIKDIPSKDVAKGYIKIAHDILEEVDHMRNVSIKNNIRRVKKKPKKK